MIFFDNITVFYGAPGCGKTTVLMDVLENELKMNDPDEIAFVSFTKRGAIEGQDRAMAKFGFSKKELPYFSTLHSLAFSDGGFSRYDVISKKDYKEFSRSMGMSFTGYYTEDFHHNDDQYLFFNSLRKNNVKVHNKLVTELDQLKYRSVAHNYDRFKKFKNVVDFDDMLIQFIEQERFLPVKVAIIDEAQDLTTLQWLFCSKAFDKCERVYIGGDDDQAIYEWAGADVKFFLRLAKLAKEKKILPKSYRMKSNILNFSQRLAQKINHRVIKDIASFSEGGEISFYNSLSDIKIDINQSYFFLSRNNYFLAKVKSHLKLLGLVFYDKNKLSIDKSLLNLIDIYKNKQALNDTQKIKMLRYLKNKDDLNIPWDENFKLSESDINYYRDIINRGFVTKSPQIYVNTIHGVKGSECENVVLLLDITRNVTESFHNDSDSELRVLYVACTRAKNHLHLVHSSSKNGYDSFFKLSMFKKGVEI